MLQSNVRRRYERLLVGESDGPAFCRELFSRLMFQFGLPAPKDLSVSGPIVIDWLGLCAMWFGVLKAACLRWMPDKVGDHSAMDVAALQLTTVIPCLPCRCREPEIPTLRYRDRRARLNSIHGTCVPVAEPPQHH
jgi:hypothetical protein